MIEWIRKLVGSFGETLQRWAGGAPQEESGGAAADPLPNLRLEFGGNPIPPIVTIDLDRPRQLRLTMRESIEYRRRSGRSLLKEGVYLLEMEEDDLLNLLCACASWQDPGVQTAELAPYIHGQKLTEIVAALMVLLDGFTPPLPEGTPEEDGEENPLQAGARMYWEMMSTGRSRQAPSA